MLETNKYVRCLMTDFAKAFDVGDHAILLGKLQTLGTDQFALNWIVSFLSNHHQVRKIDRSYSISSKVQARSYILLWKVI